MRMGDVIEAARGCYPDEFTVNGLIESIDGIHSGRSIYNVKTEIRSKLENLIKFGMVERRNEGRSVYYRYVPEIGGDDR